VSAPLARLVTPAALALAILAGCGSGDGGSPQTRSAEAGRMHAPVAPAAAEPLRHATCPAEAANCRSAEGTIIYVERIDPDGDGDAHFVLASEDSVTAPGLAVIDVERGLRPQPLPGPGDRVSAAGPVYRGSYGQRQIQAEELHVAD
jgi:hypothetical protein